MNGIRQPEPGPQDVQVAFPRTTRNLTIFDQEFTERRGRQRDLRKARTRTHTQQAQIARDLAQRLHVHGGCGVHAVSFNRSTTSAGSAGTSPGAWRIHSSATMASMVPAPANSRPCR